MEAYIIGPGDDGKGKDEGVYTLVTAEGEVIISMKLGNANEFVNSAINASEEVQGKLARREVRALVHIADTDAVTVEDIEKKISEYIAAHPDGNNPADFKKGHAHGETDVDQHVDELPKPEDTETA